MLGKFIQNFKNFIFYKLLNIVFIDYFVAEELILKRQKKRREILDLISLWKHQPKQALMQKM